MNTATPATTESLTSFLTRHGYHYDATTGKATRIEFVVAEATPQELGEHDARNGYSCRPEYHFGEADDMYRTYVRYQRADYIGAYIKAKGL